MRRQPPQSPRSLAQAVVTDGAEEKRGRKEVAAVPGDLGLVGGREKRHLLKKIILKYEFYSTER